MLSFEKNTHRTSYKRYFFRTATIKDYSVMIDRKKVFDQPVKNDRRTYNNVRNMEMNTQQAVYYIMFISKMIIK